MISRPSLISRLRRGDTLHMGFVEGEKVWWLEGPYEEVEDALAQEMVSGKAIKMVASGDSLFGPNANSQTFVARKRGRAA